MNLLIIIFTIVFLLGLTDFVAPNNKRLHNQIYHLAFFITWFLFSIRYYYGADISIYVPMYNTLPTPFELLKGDSQGQTLEIGFLMFCSILKSLGFSYWAITAVITAIYFYSIYRLFAFIPQKKAFALCLLVLFDFNLIFATHRQCLAVSCFILMVLAFHEKKYLKMFLLALFTALMHKSGFYFGIGISCLLLMRVYIKNNVYIFLLGVLFLMLLMPVNSIIMFIADKLPLDATALVSINYHLSFAQTIQSMLLIYVLVLFSLYVYSNKDKMMKEFGLVAFVGAVLIAFLYKYYPILWRLRSYFIPFIIVYLFYAIQNSSQPAKVSVIPSFKRLSPLYNSVITIVVILFCAYTIVGSYKLQNSLKSRIYETSTIFDLFDKDKEDIIKDRINRASYYWHNENLE